MSGGPENSDKATLLSGRGVAISGGNDGMPARVRRVLREDLAECGLSRIEVLGRLAELGASTTGAMLDAYVADSKPHRFPAELIPAWVKVTGSRRILDLVCGECGLATATADDQGFAELGRIKLRGEKLAQKLWDRV